MELIPISEEQFNAMTSHGPDQREPDDNYVGNLAREVGQGALFNFEDEAEAGARAAYGKLVNGEDYLPNYKKTRDDIRGDLRKFEGENPGTALTANLLGGLATGAAGVGKVAALRAASGLGRMGLATGAGVGSGVLSEVGASKELDDLKASEIQNAALLGGGIGLLGSGAVQALKSGGSFVGNLGKGRSTEESIAQNWDNNQEKFKDAVRFVKEAEESGSPLQLVDYPGMSGMGTKVRAGGGEAQEVLEKSLRDRSIDEGTRVTEQLNKLTPQKQYFETLDDIAEQFKPTENKLYLNAVTKHPPLESEKLIRMIEQRPSLKKMLPKTLDDLRDTGDEFAIYDSQSKQVGMNVIDQMKKNLDNQISALRTAGEKGEARRLTLLKNDLIKEADDLNPDYAKARAQAADRISLENALEQGSDFRKMGTEEITRHVKTLDEPDYQAWLIGVRNDILSQADKTSETGSIAKRILGTPEKEKRLRAAFKDSGDFEVFKKSLDSEATAQRTSNSILAGAPTHQRFSDAKPSGLSPSGLLMDAITADAPRRVEGMDQKQLLRLATALTSRKEAMKLLQSSSITAEDKLRIALMLNQAQIGAGVFGGNQGSK